MDNLQVSTDFSNKDAWPSLAFQDWKDTYATLHMWTQIVGKIRLVQTPWVNHAWHTTLYVTSTGLTTSPIPYHTRTFQISFDFIEHKLIIQTTEGQVETMQLVPRSVADFYEELLMKLADLKLNIKIHSKPNEVVNAILFEKDFEHKVYTAEYANKFWRMLIQADRVFKKFRAGFVGKCSPVHFFWGSFDLAVTRFSGRSAPEHPGGFPNLPNWVAREAYSHEVCSCGFWLGNEQMPEAIFYSYAYPEPKEFSSANIVPDVASYNSQLKEFILPYEAVRQSTTPDKTLLEFLQTSYEAAANTGSWDRSALERSHLGA